jgi:hypothetical protein
MLELISFIVIISLLAVSVLGVLYLRIQNVRLSKTLAQTIIDKIIALDRLGKELELKDNKSLEQTEGFIKFVSQSRDYAFEYIEDAQERIASFDKELNNIINLGGNKKETVKLILAAYQPIRELLPEEQGEK